MSTPDQPGMTVAELSSQVDVLIDEIKTDIEAYDERAALQTIDDNLTTTQRALAALNRSERFAGEHEVARRWLEQHAPENGTFRRRGSE